jgi:hypothetical protein
MNKQVGKFILGTMLLGSLFPVGRENAKRIISDLHGNKYYSSIDERKIENIPEFKGGSLEYIADRSEVDYESDAQFLYEIKKEQGDSDFLRGANYREIIDFIETPIEARALILSYRERNKTTDKIELFFRSFRDIYEGDFQITCKEASIIAAATLHDNGYPPLILLMDSEGIDHACFLYKKDNKFGSIDNNLIIPPGFAELENLVKYYSKIQGTKYTGYCLLNLDETNPGWIDSTEPYFPKIRLNKIKEEGK